MTIILCSCNKNENNYSNVEINNMSITDAEFVSIKEKNGMELSDLISFDNYCSFVSLNTNNDVKQNTTISICGTFFVSDTISELNCILSEKINGITLYSNEKKVLYSSNFSWVLTQADKGVNFELIITPAEIDLFDEIIKLTEIEFSTPIISFTKSLNQYYLMPYYDNNNGVKVIESPAAPKLRLEKGAKITLSYIVMTLNSNFNPNFNVNVNYPDECTDIISIEDIVVTENIDMANSVLDQFKLDLTLEQKKSLKVYNINVTYCKNEDVSIVAQPLLNLNISGEEQTISPFCILTFTE